MKISNKLGNNIGKPGSLSPLSYSSRPGIVAESVDGGFESMAESNE